MAFKVMIVSKMLIKAPHHMIDTSWGYGPTVFLEILTAVVKTINYLKLGEIVSLLNLCTNCLGSDAQDCL